MSKINLSSTPPIADIRRNMVFAANGNVVLAFETVLPEIYSLSENDFEEIHSAWFQSLKSLPTGTVVHKQDVYLKRNYSAEKLPNHTFLEKATHSYFKNREHLEHRSYLFFIHTKNKSFNHPKYVNPFKKVSRNIPFILVFF